MWPYCCLSGCECHSSVKTIPVELAELEVAVSEKWKRNSTGGSIWQIEIILGKKKEIVLIKSVLEGCLVIFFKMKNNTMTSSEAWGDALDFIEIKHNVADYW